MLLGIPASLQAMAMELKPGGNGKSVLAIAMLAATGTPDALQPGAFARITSWSHGHASVDTGKCSEWGNTDDPVFLPISVQDGLDAAMELEVSLWEEVTGESGDISRMFDAVAEVSLPPPKDLGTSERHSIERWDTLRCCRGRLCAGYATRSSRMMSMLHTTARYRYHIMVIELAVLHYFILDETYCFACCQPAKLVYCCTYTYACSMQSYI